MPNFCAAFCCNNASDKEICKERGVSFHKFPLNNPELLKIWCARVKRVGFKPTQYSVLCSDHFEEDAFEHQNFTGK